MALAESGALDELSVDWRQTLETARDRANKQGFQESDREWSQMLIQATITVLEHCPPKTEGGQPSDEQTQRALIEGGHPGARTVREVYDAVCNLAQLPVGSLPEGPVALDYEAVAKLVDVGAGSVRTAVIRDATADTNLSPLVTSPA